MSRTRFVPPEAGVKSGEDPNSRHLWISHGARRCYEMPPLKVPGR
jgi:hypothetical protein